MTQTNSISGRGIKNPSLYSRTVEEEYLRQLSKACLVDILIETLRLNSGEGDTPLTTEALRAAVEVTVTRRGDRAPKAVRPALETRITIKKGKA